MSGEVPTDVPPAAFGRFRVLHQIGVGSLGPVFRGEDPDTGVAVAIKQLRLKLPPERAAQVAAALDALVARLPRHPAIVPVIDAGVQHHDPYLVTAFASGDSLDAALREYGPASIADAAPRLQRLAEALDRGAARDVVHGALHPRDILIAGEDTHLTGLGVAAVLIGAGFAPAARRPYMAPELANGGAPLPESDQYALAAIAYEWLFGGRAPRSAEAALDAPRLEGVDNDALKSALMRALSADPHARFGSCTSFVERLAASMNHVDATSLQSSSRLDPLPLPLTLDDEPDPADVLRPAAPAREVRPADVVRASGPTGLEDEARHPAFEFPEEGVEAPSPADMPTPDTTRDIDTGAEDAGVSTPLVVEPLRPRAPEPPVDVPGADRTAGDRAAERPEHSPVAVAWQGSLGRSEPPPDAASRHSGLRSGLVIATLVGGLAIGGLAGYLFGMRTAEPAGAGGDGTVDTSAGTEAETASGREFTEAPVAANAAPESGDREAPPAAAPKPPAVAAESPRLLIRTSPAGAAVTVDGTPRGRTPLTLRDLPLGTRALTISRPGYVAVQRRVTLSAEAPSQSLEVQLTPIAPRTPPSRTVAPDTPGSLVIESRPAGATVIVNGRLVGTTPVTVAAVAAGSHTVRLELPGHRPWTAAIIVKPGEKRRIGASLETGQNDE